MMISIDVCYYDSPHTWLSDLFFCSGIEDQDNWHGKPIPKDRVDELINDLLSQIQSPNKHLHPQQPNDDAAPANLAPIHLLTPPEYKIGDKVINWDIILHSCWSFDRFISLSKCFLSSKVPQKEGL